MPHSPNISIRERERERKKKLEEKRKRTYGGGMVAGFYFSFSLKGKYNEEKIEKVPFLPKWWNVVINFLFDLSAQWWLFMRLWIPYNTKKSSLLNDAFISPLVRPKKTTIARYIRRKVLEWVKKNCRGMNGKLLFSVMCSIYLSENDFEMYTYRKWSSCE